MEASLYASGFWWGVLGGFLAELLQWFGMRRTLPADLPEWTRSPFYWAITLLMILAGGGLVVVYVESSLLANPFIAVNIGASAPLILGKLAQQTPKLNPGNVD